MSPRYARDSGAPQLRTRRGGGAFIAAVAGLFAVGITLRALHLCDVIRIDEATTYVRFVILPWREAAVAYDIPNNHILNTLLVKATTGLFGPAEWALRLPNFVAGAGTMALTAVLARRWFGRVAAVAALAVVAISPAAIHYSVLARGYGLGVFLGLFALYAVEKKHSTERPIVWAIATAIAAACAVYALTSMVLFLLPVAAYDFALTLRKRPAARLTWVGAWFGAAALTAVAYAPVVAYNGWGLVFANQYNEPRELSSMGQYLRLYGRTLGDQKTFGLGGPWLWGALFVAGVIAGALKRKSFGLLLLFCSVVLAGFFAAGIPLVTRVLFYLLPLLALGVGAFAAWVVKAARFERGGSAWAGAVATLIFAGAAGFGGETANLIDDSLRSGVAPEAPALAAALAELPPVTRVAAGAWFYDTTVHYYLIKMGAPTDALDRSSPQAFTFEAYIVAQPRMTAEEVAYAYFWEPLPIVDLELVREVEGIGIWKAVMFNPR